MDRAKQKHKLKTIPGLSHTTSPTKDIVYSLTSRNNPNGFYLVKTNMSPTFDMKTRTVQFVQLNCAKQSHFAELELELYKACTEQVK